VAGAAVGRHSRSLLQQHPRLHQQLPLRSPSSEPGSGDARLLRLPHLPKGRQGGNVPHRMAQL